MFYFVLRALCHGWGKTALGASVAGLIVALLLVFEGFRAGVYDQLKAFPSKLPGALVVLEADTRNYTAAVSSLPQPIRATVEEIPGVKQVHPFASIPTILETDGARTPIRLIAHETAGGPQHLVAGRVCSQAVDLVMDWRLARKHHFKIGDKVEILGHDFELAGLSKGTGSPFAPYVFVTYDGLLDLYFGSNTGVALEQVILLSGLLIDVAAGVSIEEIRRQIETRASDADVFRPSELGLNDASLGKRLLGPALSLIIVIAGIIAVLAMSLLLYSAASGRLREYAIQKALGVPQGRIALGLMGEGLVLVSLGFPVGLLAARAIGAVIERFSPLYAVLVWEPLVVAQAAAIAFFATCLGTIPPVRRILQVEADLVFRR